MVSGPAIFQTCSYCGKSWPTRDHFLMDPAVEICGYQADPRQTENGLFLFRHRKADCGNTMSVSIMDFMDLHTGPVHEHNRFSTPACQGHCLDINDLLLCTADCRNASIRDVLADVLRIHWEAVSRANDRLKLS